MMAKKHLRVRNPLGQREAIVPEAIRPQIVTDTNLEIKQQGNNVTNDHSATPHMKQANEQKKPALKRYATYLRPDSIKFIQHSAIEKDCTDYEIVQAAIDRYFEQQTQ
jgi:hypothetical protein